MPGICDSYDLIKAVSGLMGQCAADEITFNELWIEITNGKEEFQKSNFWEK